MSYLRPLQQDNVLRNRSKQTLIYIIFLFLQILFILHFMFGFHIVALFRYQGLLFFLLFLVLKFVYITNVIIIISITRLFWISKLGRIWHYFIYLFFGLLLHSSYTLVCIVRTHWRVRCYFDYYFYIVIAKSATLRQYSPFADTMINWLFFTSALSVFTNPSLSYRYPSININRILEIVIFKHQLTFFFFQLIVLEFFDTTNYFCLFDKKKKEKNYF